MMTTRAFGLLTLTIALTSSGTTSLATQPGAGADVYARMQHANPTLHSYSADLHVDVKLNTFPFISPKLDGTAYFKRPDKNAVVFHTVPALAQQFKKVYPQMEPPSEWPDLYAVTPVGDDGTTTTFRLVRKKVGRIDHVDVKADDKTAMVTSTTYVYKTEEGGGSVTFSQTYDEVDGNYLIKSQIGKVDIPHYNADVTSSFSNYKLNVSVPDAVFDAQ